MKKRLDLWLVENKFAATRSRARALVEGGQVFLKGPEGERPIEKVAYEVRDQDQIEVRVGEADRYVSRAGLKLEGALQKIRLSVESFHCLDIGQSTGGFTDCLLRAGAKRVVGVDVGRDQLAKSLRGDERLHFFEGLNARELSRATEVLSLFSEEKADLVVMDLSFISQTLVLPELSGFVREGSRLLSLVKPQFEVGPEGLGKGGIVRDPLLYEEVRSKISRTAEDLGWRVLDFFESPLPGKDGNKEFFIHGIKKHHSDSADAFPGKLLDPEDPSRGS